MCGLYGDTINFDLRGEDRKDWIAGMWNGVTLKPAISYCKLKIKAFIFSL